MSSIMRPRSARLYQPKFDELRTVLEDGLKQHFFQVEVDIVECPDLSEAPYKLTVDGLCGRTIIYEMDRSRKFVIPKKKSPTKEFMLKEFERHNPHILFGTGDKTLVNDKRRDLDSKAQLEQNPCPSTDANSSRLFVPPTGTAHDLNACQNSVTYSSPNPENDSSNGPAVFGPPDNCSAERINSCRQFVPGLIVPKEYEVGQAGRKSHETSPGDIDLAQTSSGTGAGSNLDPHSSNLKTSVQAGVSGKPMAEQTGSSYDNSMMRAAPKSPPDVQGEHKSPDSCEFKNDKDSNSETLRPPFSTNVDESRSIEESASKKSPSVFDRIDHPSPSQREDNANKLTNNITFKWEEPKVFHPIQRNVDPTTPGNYSRDNPLFPNFRTPTRIIQTPGIYTIPRLPNDPVEKNPGEIAEEEGRRRPDRTYFIGFPDREDRPLLGDITIREPRGHPAVMKPGELARRVYDPPYYIGTPERPAKNESIFQRRDPPPAISRSNEPVSQIDNNAIDDDADYHIGIPGEPKTPLVQDEIPGQDITHELRYNIKTLVESVYHFASDYPISVFGPARGTFNQDRHCEFAGSASYDYNQNQKVELGSCACRCAYIDGDGNGRWKDPSKSDQIGHKGNFFMSQGKRGQVIRIHVKGTSTSKGLIGILRNTLITKYGIDKPVSMGGVYLIKKGTVGVNQMPENFPNDYHPLKNPGRSWTKTYDAETRPLVCLSVFHSHDPGLRLNMEHTHCYPCDSDKEAAHLLYEYGEREYEGYFSLAERVYKLDDDDKI